MGEVLTDGFSDRGSTPLISILRTKQTLLHEVAKGICSKNCAEDQGYLHKQTKQAEILMILRISAF